MIGRPARAGLRLTVVLRLFVHALKLRAPRRRDMAPAGRDRWSLSGLQLIGP